MAIQMRRGNLADFDPTKQMPGEFAVTLDTDSNLNKRVYIAFAAGTVKQLMTVEDATAQMIEATDAATAEAEAWAHGNSFTATEMFTSAGSATVTLAYSPSSINAVKINDVATTAYTRNGKVITFNTAPAVGSIITVIYGVSTSTDNAKYYKGQAANSASTASTKATQASTSATNAANSASTASTKATQAGNSATLSESYAVGGTGTRTGENSDNSKYYYEQARDISQSLSGALKPRGTVTYVNLPSLSVALAGDMYNVSDAFTTTNDFKEGAGHHINAGANVYKTFDGKWDILAGTPVTGVKGDKEQNYRQGNVNLTPANIGAASISEQYAECSTARNVAAKTVTLAGFKLETGARISVRFTDTGSSNPASGNITLNVNGTGAKEVVDSHTNMTKMTYTSNWFYNNLVNDFVYDGTYWVWMNRDNNTTYSSKAAASGGTATSLCTTGEKYTWNNKQNALTFDNVPTQNSNNPVKSGGIYSKIGDLTQTGLTGDSVAEQLTTVKGQVKDVSSGIFAITHKNITASTENELLLAALADMKADSNSYTYASINRIYTWSGHDHYIIQGYRVTSAWIYAFVYSYDRAYILEYNIANEVISLKKTFTLT